FMIAISEAATALSAARSSEMAIMNRPFHDVRPTLRTQSWSFQYLFPEQLWDRLWAYLINMKALPLWVNRDPSATVFGGKQTSVVLADDLPGRQDAAGTAGAPATGLSGKFPHACIIRVRSRIMMEPRR
ncbi:MAG: hypothetical protein ACRDTH_17950, partial [Pseudonocardiaceae bacterium]